jgi:hypothetical protein
LVASCTNSLIDQSAGKQGSAVTAAASGSGFHGLNWADERDNFVNGWLVLSGCTSSDSYATQQTKAGVVLSAFQGAGANTVSIPINPQTVNDTTWWPKYKGTIDKASSMGMNVLLGFWDNSGASCDSSAYWTMWDKVISDYGGNSKIYFDVYNEPHVYSASAWLAVCAKWLSRYSSISRGRVVIGGSGYDDTVTAVGGDSRVSGCLFEQHYYPDWNKYTSENDWYNLLSSRVGSYSGSTIVGEYGAPMTTGLNYQPGDPYSGGNYYVAFMYGFPNCIHDKSMGSIYWIGLKNNDSYTLFTHNSGCTSLSLNNSSGRNQIKWAWRQ